MRIAQGEVGLPLRCARQRQAVQLLRVRERPRDARRRAAVDAVRVRLVAAGLHEQVRILDLGVVVAGAEAGAPVVRQDRLQVQFHALARDLVRVDQLVHVDGAAAGRQLLVLHAVLEHGGGQARAAVEHVGLDARFVRQRLLGAGQRRLVGQAVQAALHRRRAVAGGDAREQVRVRIQRVAGRAVPADVVRIAVQRQRAARLRRFEALGDEVLLVARVAQAAAQLEAVRDLVVQRAERGPRARILRLRRVRRVLRIARRQRVEADRIDADVLVEVEQAGHPLQRILRVRFETHFLRQLAVRRQQVGRLDGERDVRVLARIVRPHRRRIHGAHAAVDVAAAVERRVLVTRDRVQRHALQVPAQAHVGAAGAQGLVVAAVGRVAVVVEAVDEVARAFLDDVGAEQRRVAFQIARVHAQQGGEVARRLHQQLHACGVVVVAFEILRVAVRIRVVHEVVAVLRLQRHAQRDRVRQRQVVRAFRAQGAVVAGAEHGIAFRAEHGFRRVELDHAGRRVAAEQRALRAAQHFDLVDVEHGEALEHRAFLHDVVDDEADRLRCVQIEVRIALAADVEAGERAAVVRFDVQRRRAAGQEADVGAAGREHVELVALDRGHGHRHVLEVLGAPLGGHDHGFQLRAGFGGRLLGRLFGGLVRFVGQGREGQRADHGGGDQAAGKYAWGTYVHVTHLFLRLERLI